MMKTENEILNIVNEKKLTRANIEKYKNYIKSSFNKYEKRIYREKIAVELGYKDYLSKRLEDLFTKDLNVLVKPIVQTSSKRPPVA